MKQNIKLKVCGLKHKNNLYDVIEAGADLVGMIFYEGSPRFVVDSLYPEDVWFLPDEVEKVGVFVDAELTDIIKYSKLYQLDLVQLHGRESPEFCESVRISGYSVIKAFGVSEDFDFKALESYEKHADFFLFDTKTPAYGGSGKAFDWQLLEKYTYSLPVLIGGGVSVGNLKKLLSYDFPFLYAADMNSKLESEPGLKDINKVRDAVKILRDSK